MLGKRPFTNHLAPIATDLYRASHQRHPSLDHLPTTPTSCPTNLTHRFFEGLTSPTHVAFLPDHPDHRLQSPTKRRRQGSRRSSLSSAMQQLPLVDVVRAGPSPAPVTSIPQTPALFAAIEQQAGPSDTRQQQSRALASSALKLDSNAEASTVSAVPRPPRRVTLQDGPYAHTLDGVSAAHRSGSQRPDGNVDAYTISPAPSLGVPRRPRPPRGPTKTLSLSIPPGSEAYGGLSAPSSLGRGGEASLSGRLPPSELCHVPTSAIDGPPMLLPAPVGRLLPSTSGRLTSAPKASRKRPVRLDLGNTSNSNIDYGMAKSVPSSPRVSHAKSEINGKHRTGMSPIEEKKKQDLRMTLTGKPRRRPSMPFGHNLKHVREESVASVATPHSGGFPTANRPPEAWRDPSEHILSGKGSTLQHARSVYAAGPIEVLPGLYLGDEHNARDDEMLADFGITTILNVAKETVLPFQSDAGVTDLRKHRPGQASLRERPGTQLTNGDSSDRPSMPMRAVSMSVADPEQFYTPVTTHFSGDLRTPVTARFNLDQDESDEERIIEDDDAYLTPMQQSPIDTQSPNRLVPVGPYLRSTSSTPNLQASFPTEVSQVADSTTADEASRTTCTNEEVLQDASEDSDLLDVNGHSSAPEAPSSLMLTTEVELAPDAITLTIPPSPVSGRLQPIRYIKLPWTHDQTELATPSGGFPQGCAVIADAMGIDYYGRPLLDENGDVVRPSNILVHCQCGVSRSATLVIAFVMQAAALNYPWDASKNLTGMHDCYNLVKELSSSISPNISLIYQLVEWERHLSAEAARLREALKAQSPEAHLIGLSSEPNGGQGGWSAEVLDEEEWTRMRREEEAKEEAEEQLRRQRILEEAKRQAEQRKLLEVPVTKADDSQLLASPPTPTFNGLPLTPSKGVGARRQKKAPSLRLGGEPGTATSPALSHGSPSDMPKTPLSLRHADNAMPGALGLDARSLRSGMDAASVAIPPPLKTPGLQSGFSFPSPLQRTEALPEVASAPAAQVLPRDGVDAEQSAHCASDSTAQATGLPSPDASPVTPRSGKADDERAEAVRPARPQSMHASMPSDLRRVGGLEPGPASASAAVLPARQLSSGMQWSVSSGGLSRNSSQAKRNHRAEQALRNIPHAPVSFNPRSRARGHGSSNSISSMQSIHASLSSNGLPSSNTSSSANLVSPKTNFGLSSGLTSAERKQQHRRTFSSEADNPSGLINWEQIRNAVVAAREEMNRGKEGSSD